MGVRKDVTLVVGGGFHGKSTLLEALQVGVYDHVPGDGREFVVTEHTAVKVRAEDGRPVTGLDIGHLTLHIQPTPGQLQLRRCLWLHQSGSQYCGVSGR
jgi:predicted ABC-class ATPase